MTKVAKKLKEIKDKYDDPEVDRQFGALRTQKRNLVHKLWTITDGRYELPPWSPSKVTKGWNSKKSRFY